MKSLFIKISDYHNESKYFYGIVKQKCSHKIKVEILKVLDDNLYLKAKFLFRYLHDCFLNLGI